MQYKRIFIIEIALAAMLLCACTYGTDTYTRKSAVSVSADAEETVSDAGLDAADTAVYLGTDDATGKVRFKSLDNGLEYELSTDSMTSYADQYGSVRVLEEFSAGDIVDLSLSVHSRKMLTMTSDAGVVSRENVTGFSINMNRGVFTADDGENYHITDNVVVIKGGEKCTADDIDAGDTLTVNLIGHDIASIKIISGLGHVRITGTEYFTGGWIQIGKNVIKPITDDMLLDVPEGEYDMSVTYHGHGGTKHISVTRDQETDVDVSDLKGELIKTGQITFTVMPVDAYPTIKINGEEIDYTLPVELEYGVYSLEVSAEGYNTVNEKISVGQEMANIEIELEAASSSSSSSSALKSTTSSSAAVTPSISTPSISTPSISTPSLSWPLGSSSSTSSGSSSSSSSSSAVTTSTGTNRLYIDAPTGAEVYYDGSYKGVAPCNFAKSAGTHVITLRRDGYVTKTYTITLDNTTDNETYSFNDLKQASD